MGDGKTCTDDSIFINAGKYKTPRKAYFIGSDLKQTAVGCVAPNAMFVHENSCFLTWQNTMWIFGGMFLEQHGNQLIAYYALISRLNNFQIEDIGYLPFRFKNGGCSIMNDEYIYLCFDNRYDSGNVCRRATDPKGFKLDIKITNSMYRHRWTQTSASDSKLLNL